MIRALPLAPSVEARQERAALTARQARVLAVLLEARSIKAAAETANVGEKTIRRWLAAEPFREAYRAARVECVRHSTARLQKAAAEAVDRLCDVMADAASPAPARVTAARSVLEFAYRASELEDIEERVRAIESRLGVKA